MLFCFLKRICIGRKMRDLIWYVLVVSFSQSDLQHLGDSRFWGLHLGLIQNWWSREGVVLASWAPGWPGSIWAVCTLRVFSVSRATGSGEGRGVRRAGSLLLYPHQQKQNCGLQKQYGAGAGAGAAVTRPRHLPHQCPFPPLPTSRSSRPVPVSELSLPTPLSPQIRFHTESSSAHRGGALLCHPRLPLDPVLVPPMPDASRAPPRPGLVWSPHPLPPCAASVRPMRERGLRPMRLPVTANRITDCPQSRDKLQIDVPCFVLVTNCRVSWTTQCLFCLSRSQALISWQSALLVSEHWAICSKFSVHQAKVAVLIIYSVRALPELEMPSATGVLHWFGPSWANSDSTVQVSSPYNAGHLYMRFSCFSPWSKLQKGLHCKEQCEAALWG